MLANKLGIALFSNNTLESFRNEVSHLVGHYSLKGYL